MCLSHSNFAVVHQMCFCLWLYFGFNGRPCETKKHFLFVCTCVAALGFNMQHLLNFRNCLTWAYQNMIMKMHVPKQKTENGEYTKVTNCAQWLSKWQINMLWKLKRLSRPTKSKNFDLGQFVWIGRPLRSLAHYRGQFSNCCLSSEYQFSHYVMWLEKPFQQWNRTW